MACTQGHRWGRTILFFIGKPQLGPSSEPCHCVETHLGILLICLSRTSLPSNAGFGLVVYGLYCTLIAFFAR